MFIVPDDWIFHLYELAEYSTKGKMLDYFVECCQSAYKKGNEENMLQKHEEKH